MEEREWKNLSAQGGRRAIYSPSRKVIVGEMSSSANLRGARSTVPGAGPPGAEAGPTGPQAGPPGPNWAWHRAVTGADLFAQYLAPGCYRSRGRSAPGQPVHSPVRPGVRPDQSGPNRAPGRATARRRGKFPWIVPGVHRSRGRSEPDHPAPRPV